MKILLINQPHNNRGDESAHRGLMRTMLRELPDAEIRVLFDGIKQESLNEFIVDSKQINYINPKPPMRHTLYYRVVKLAMWLNCPLPMYLYPAYWRKIKHYKWADLVVGAPGGMCMGGFQNWGHVFNLYVAKFMKKPLAYYGRSIGPFPTKTFSNRLFRKMSMRMLDYFMFTSLRDRKSEKIAAELGFHNIVGVVDSAFLDSPKVEIPTEIQKQLGDKPYFVFVPNLLIWHVDYKGKLDRSMLIDYYCQMLEVLFKVHPDCNAVMLPQTCCADRYDGNDVNLFREIAEKKGDKRVIVVSDKYGSDIQQTIIADAKLMVGLMYHSIVFALNQGIPFVSLSYEHKMSGLLETLGKEDCMVNVQESIFTEDGRKSILKQLEEKARTAKPDAAVREKAKQIAMKGFEAFKKQCIKSKNRSLSPPHSLSKNSNI